MGRYTDLAWAAKVRQDKTLDLIARLILLEIEHLTHKFGYCNAGNKYFADMFGGVTEDYIRKQIKTLETKGHLRIENPKSKNRKLFVIDKYKITQPQTIVCSTPDYSRETTPNYSLPYYKDKEELENTIKDKDTQGVYSSSLSFANTPEILTKELLDYLAENNLEFIKDKFRSIVEERSYSKNPIRNQLSYFKTYLNNIARKV